MFKVGNVLKTVGLTTIGTILIELIATLRAEDAALWVARMALFISIFYIVSHFELIKEIQSIVEDEKNKRGSK